MFDSLSWNSVVKFDDLQKADPTACIIPKEYLLSTSEVAKMLSATFKLTGP